MPLRIVLMGTGEFALPAFRAVIESDHIVVGLFTQPDKTGRGHHQHINPLKQLAQSCGIAVFQPERINRAEFLDILRSLQADVFLVAAYGQILKPELLSIPRLGCFNLHGSLLPRHRGAAPVQYSIWSGDTETGVTIFRIEPSLDSGPIVGRVTTPIGSKETSGQLMTRLADLSVPLTLEVLSRLESGTADFEIQNSEQVTLAPKISKEQGAIHWQQSARQIDRHIRAMQPWPRAFTTLRRVDTAPIRCLIHEVAFGEEVLPNDAVPASVLAPATELAPVGGTIRIAQNRLFVQSADGLVEILRIQLDGSRPITAGSFLNGYALNDTDRFQ